MLVQGGFMTEFTTGFMYGIIAMILIRAAITAIEWYRRRNLLREFPEGILKIDLDEASYPETNLQLAKLHREKPNMAIILNGKRF